MNQEDRQLLLAFRARTVAMVERCAEIERHAAANGIDNEQTQATTRLRIAMENALAELDWQLSEDDQP